MRQTILQFDRPVPRYTSYPTAPHFQIVEGGANPYKEWLKGVRDQGPVSVYLHVPFCSKMCWYCGCHTKITRQHAPVQAYVDLMLREIELVSQAMAVRQDMCHVHFGGGSPGILQPSEFTALMDCLKTHFPLTDGADVAIELDPRGINDDKVAAYAKAGVNRVSLGVQDFDDQVLAHVNRQQPFELSEQAMALFRNHGIDQVNFDLIYGLPYQTPDTMRSTMQKALSLNPDRISLFGYAHVPWMKKHMRLLDEGALPDAALRFDLFELGAQIIREAGYEMIGIDHFAKPDDPLVQARNAGTLRRNFQGYTVDGGENLIGIGASSIGRTDQGYAQNAVDMTSYRAFIEAGELAVQKTCPIHLDDQVRARVIEAIMCYLQVDLDPVIRSFGLPVGYFDHALDTLKPYQDEGLVTVQGTRITVNPQAHMITRLIASAFDAYWGGVETSPRHARAV